MRSKDAYLKRKRDSQRHRIVEAEKMVGKKIEVRSIAAYTPRPKVLDLDLSAHISDGSVRVFGTVLP